jgi:hypothetical protein
MSAPDVPKLEQWSEPSSARPFAHDHQVHLHLLGVKILSLNETNCPLLCPGKDRGWVSAEISCQERSCPKNSHASATKSTLACSRHCESRPPVPNLGDPDTQFRGVRREKSPGKCPLTLRVLVIANHGRSGNWKLFRDCSSAILNAASLRAAPE